MRRTQCTVLVGALPVQWRSARAGRQSETFHAGRGRRPSRWCFRSKSASSRATGTPRCARAPRRAPGASVAAQSKCAPAFSGAGVRRARPFRSPAVVARGIHTVPPLLIPISPWHARAPGGRAACRAAAAWRRSSGTAAQLLQRARAALSRSSSHGRPPHGASSSKGLSARTHRAPQAVLTALVATAGVVAVCCALAFLTPLDFTKCARSRPGAGAAAPAHAEGWHMALTLTITLKAVPVLARCSSATLTWVLAAPVSVRGAAPL